MSGGKNIENRTWQTDYRGPIVIHAGAAKTVVNRFVGSGGPALSAMKFSYGALIASSISSMSCHYHKNWKRTLGPGGPIAGASPIRGLLGSRFPRKETYVFIRFQQPCRLVSLPRSI